MIQKSRLTHIFYVAIAVFCMNGSLFAAWGSGRAPASQMCAEGSYVIGFDSESNIICTGACGNGVMNPGEFCDDGNTENGDSCPANCQSAGTEAVDADKGMAAEAVPVVVGSSVSTPYPTISDVKPSKVVFGKRELTISVRGTGFSSKSVVIFKGTEYAPSINQAGTELKVTIPIRGLNYGPYAVTVSNGSKLKTTLKKALEVY